MIGHLERVCPHDSGRARLPSAPGTAGSTGRTPWDVPCSRLLGRRHPSDRHQSFGRGQEDDGDGVGEGNNEQDLRQRCGIPNHAAYGSLDVRCPRGVVPLVL